MKSGSDPARRSGKARRGGSNPPGAQKTQDYTAG